MARRRLIRLRRGTAAEWTAANPVLESGEPGVETDTGQGKIGDGSTAWNSLDYIGTGGGGASGPAGGVLSGTYPNPGFAADMATQAELDAHTGDTSDAHDASAISFSPAGTIAATDVQAAIEEVAAEAGGGGAVATDAIWDAKGDLAVGSGANTADNLAVGTDGQILAANSSETLGVEWVDAPGMDLETPSGTINGSNVTFTLSTTPTPSANLLLFKNGLLQDQGVDYTLSGTTITFTTAPATGSTLLAGIPVTSGGGGGGGIEVLDLVTRSTDLTVTAASAGTAQDWITGNAISLDGSTVVLIEVFCPFVNATAAAEIIFELYDDASDVGRIGQFDYTGSAYAATIVTPSNGSHTYKVKAWRTGSNRTLSSASPWLGSYYRVTVS